MKFILIFTLVISFMCISCKEEKPYTYTKEKALKIMTTFPGETVIDSFGGEGPYKETGGIQSNPNIPVSFYVINKGKKITKKYPAEENTSYISHNYENKSGDGFIVISKFTVKKKDK